MGSAKQSKPELDRQIDENLRKVYERALDEEVPKRFHDLLQQLKAQEGKK